MKKHLLTLIAFFGLASVGFGQIFGIENLSGNLIPNGDTVVVYGTAGTVGSPALISDEFYVYDSSIAINFNVLCVPQPDSVATSYYSICVGTDCYAGVPLGKTFTSGNFKAPAGKDTNGLYTDYDATAPGTTIIRYDVRNTLKTDSAWIYVKFVATLAGITPVTNDLHISSLFPNPANSTVSFTYHSDYDAQLSIYNSLGQSLKTMTISASKENASINVSDMPSGIYICKLQSAGADAVFRKLIVSH